MKVITRSITTKKREYVYMIFSLFSKSIRQCCLWLCQSEERRKREKRKDSWLYPSSFAAIVEDREREVGSWLSFRRRRWRRWRWGRHEREFAARSWKFLRACFMEARCVNSPLTRCALLPNVWLLLHDSTRPSFWSLIIIRWQT